MSSVGTVYVHSGYHIVSVHIGFMWIVNSWLGEPRACSPCSESNKTQNVAPPSLLT